MQKVLFIDRDGTILVEPPDDFQVDSLEKMEFVPKVISNLRKIAVELDYKLVLVSNQDGLGTAAFPEEHFWPAQNKMLKILRGEGIEFSEILIDRSLPQESKSTRKPGTGMLLHYFQGGYDLAHSYVIGDRPTDVELAQNLGARAIYLNNHKHKDAVLSTADWDEVYNFLKLPPRKARSHRKTRETDIEVDINLDGEGLTRIETGIAFFDHMLDQIGRHSGIDLNITARGDLQVDEHHTIEDTAIALGETLHKALGDKRGISRYGFLLPMDDALAQVAIDFGGRPWLVWEVEFKREKIGEVPTEMFFHFFKSFSDAARCNLNIQATGENEHHKIEAVFKACARAIKMAVRRDPTAAGVLPSTKGTL
jgi:imidazoleglycerol-phosphate dehydratase / histidinol-phosphatase